ncbi:MAG: VanZ family protein [Pirellulaceae bacterium]
MDRCKSPQFRWTVTCAYFAVLSHSLLAPSPLWYLGPMEPAIQEGVTGRFADYWQHLVAFQLLALLVCWARGPNGFPAVRTCLPTLLGYAIISEALQALVPSRSCELRDMAANLLGVLTGWLMGATLCRWHAQRPVT